MSYAVEHMPSTNASHSSPLRTLVDQRQSGEWAYLTILSDLTPISTQA